MRKLPAYLVLFFALPLVSQAQSGWSATTLPVSGRYDDIFFLNETTGWAVGGDLKIFHTVNAGQTWDLQFSAAQYLRSVEFATPTLGFCGSLDSALYKTTDGGITWTDISNTIQPRPAGICGLSAPDPLHIYGCGIWKSPAFIIRSSDGGNTWTYTDMSAYAHTLVDIYFTSKDTGFVTGTANPASDGGVVLYTTDGGNTWTVKFKTMVPDEYVWKIQSPDDKHFFGSVNSVPSSPNTRMLRSADRGLNWESKIVKNNFFDVEMVGFSDSLNGWTGGRRSLFHTTDGGNTWSNNLVTNNRNFNRFLRVNETTLYLSGVTVYKQELEPAPPPPTADSVEEHTIQVSPNPVTGSCRIDLYFAQNTFASLLLYNMQGKRVKTLLHRNANRGKTSVPLDLTAYPASAYFLVLRTNEGFVNYKLIKR